MSKTASSLPGQLGGTPAVANQQLNATIIAQTRLESVQEFENILVKVNNDGSQVRLKDVARVELGAENYMAESFYQRQTLYGIAVRLTPGANAIDTAAAVRARVDELKPFFPQRVWKWFF